MDEQDSTPQQHEEGPASAPASPSLSAVDRMKQGLQRLLARTDAWKQRRDEYGFQQREERFEPKPAKPGSPDEPEAPVASPTPPTPPAPDLGTVKVLTPRWKVFRDGNDFNETARAFVTLDRYDESIRARTPEDGDAEVIKLEVPPPKLNNEAQEVPTETVDDWIKDRLTHGLSGQNKADAARVGPDARQERPRQPTWGELRDRFVGADPRSR